MDFCEYRIVGAPRHARGHDRAVPARDPWPGAQLSGVQPVVRRRGRGDPAAHRKALCPKPTPSRTGDTPAPARVLRGRSSASSAARAHVRRRPRPVGPVRGCPGPRRGGSRGVVWKPSRGGCVRSGRGPSRGSGARGRLARGPGCPRFGEGRGGEEGPAGVSRSGSGSGGPPRAAVPGVRTTRCPAPPCGRSAAGRAPRSAAPRSPAPAPPPPGARTA